MPIENERDELIARTKTEVLKELKANEPRAFSVADLRTHLKGLGDVAAWKITYDTASGPIERGVGRVNPGDTAAWKITYDTAMGPPVTKTEER